MQPRLFLMAVLLLATLAVTNSGKVLQNLKGQVSYAVPSGAPQALAQNAGIALRDRDEAITGAASLAGVNLPDSSRVLVGSNTRVQLAFFNQRSIAHAKFVLYHGRIRFTVEHPAGARADYVFQTPTASVSVRGTQGDIGLSSDGTLRVNVYSVSDPNLPVEVTLPDGNVITLVAGKSLLARMVNGIVQTQVENLTQQLVNQFSPDFGVPTNWTQLKQTLIQQVKNRLPCPPFIGCPPREASR